MSPQALPGGAVHPAGDGTAHPGPEGVPQAERRQGHGSAPGPEARQHLPGHQAEREAGRLRPGQDSEPRHQLRQDVCWNAVLHVSCRLNVRIVFSSQRLLQEF